jgi:2-enoate reductase
MRCEVNPATGRENDFRIILAELEKKIVVIGGGPAGMEAARVAAIRGHEVTLIEKNKDLGGHLIEGSRPLFKDDTKRLLRWLTKQVYKVGVEVKLETEATPELIRVLKPDVLIIAVGSDPIVSEVPNANSTVIEASDVLLGKRDVGDKVVVIGGGLVGCETALYAAEELKKKVAIVEMLDEILNGMEPVSSIALTERLGKAGVEVHMGWHLEEITSNKVICADKMWKRHEIKADTVVLAMGLKAKNESAKEFIDLAPEVHIVGDCVEARKIYNAFEDSWRAVLAT